MMHLLRRYDVAFRQMMFASQNDVLPLAKIVGLRRIIMPSVSLRLTSHTGVKPY